MKKLISLILTVTMALTLLVGCQSTATPTTTKAGDATAAATTAAAAAATTAAAADGSIQVGVVLPTKDEPRWIQDQEKFEAILTDAGFTNQVMFSQGSSDTEKKNVETLITKGIKVLVICANDASAAAATVEAAKDAGITVICYDRLITGTDAVDYYVTFDSITVGAEMGKYLVDNATGTGNSLYLYAGAATDNNAFLFFQGAWEVLQPKIADGTFVIRNSAEAVAVQDTLELTRDQIATIIGQITTDWDMSVAKSKAEANLTAAAAADKGDCFILAPNDGTARSIADVFAADPDVTSYLITGQDAEISSVQYVIDGKQSMTVFKDTRTLASDAVAMAVSILGGETPATDAAYNNGTVDVPSKQTSVVVVTKDNVQSALIDSGYYDATEFTGLG